MALCEVFIENKGVVKGNGVTSFKQKEVRNTVVTRANIVVKFVNEAFDKDGIVGDTRQVA